MPGCHGGPGLRGSWVWYTMSEMGLEELRLLGQAVAPLAGAAAWIGISYYGLLKLIDYENRQVTESERIVSIDWLDPDLRQN